MKKETINLLESAGYFPICGSPFKTLSAVAALSGVLTPA